MNDLPLPRLDALPLGAHRLFVLGDEALFDRVGVRIAFTGREGGVSEGAYASLNTGGHVGDDPRSVSRNRAILQEACGCDGAPVVVPNQVHGTNVIEVAAAERVATAQILADEGADAVVVACPGVSALLNFADCLPLVIVSPTGRFAVAHAGWRGAVAGIAGKAAAALARADAAAGEGCGTAPFNAYIGPHIGPECFEVGQDVAQRFEDAFGAGVLRGPRHVDLAKAVGADLVRAGMAAQRIADCGICTKCNSDRYFSYRATDGRCGRHAAFAYRGLR